REQRKRRREHVDAAAHPSDRFRMNRMDGEEERAAERRERDAAEEPREPVHERRVQRVEQHRREMKAERVSPPQTLIEPERRERQRTEDTRNPRKFVGSKNASS